METLSFNVIIDEISNFLAHSNLTFNDFNDFKRYMYFDDFVKLLNSDYSMIIDTKYLDEILETYYNIFYNNEIIVTK